jgi:hypothetical protein
MRADPLSLNVSGQWLFAVADPPDFQNYLQYPNPRPSFTSLGPIPALSVSRSGAPRSRHVPNSRLGLPWRWVSLFWPSLPFYPRLGPPAHIPRPRTSQRGPFSGLIPWPFTNLDVLMSPLFCGPVSPSSSPTQPHHSGSCAMPLPSRNYLSGNISIAYNLPVPAHCPAQSPH